MIAGADSTRGRDMPVATTRLGEPEDLRVSLGGEHERPQHLGRYRIEGLIGCGGMGIVYAAHDPELGREVAIKLLLPGRGGAQAQSRLQREAQTLARLDHPNVVSVYDVGVEGEQLYIAMERIEGPSLRAWLAARPRTWPEIVDVFLAAGQGLVAAHEAGLIHRDFKPDNVLVDAQGRARVVDFGLARLAGTRAGEGGEPRGDVELRRVDADVELLPTLTGTGEILGTPAYMAPEQRRGLASDARADLFAFCVALWEALSGERPAVVGPAGAPELRRAHGASPPIPRAIGPLLARGLAASPEQRWPSLATLLERLAKVRRRRDPRRIQRRRRFAATGLVLLGLGLGLDQGRRAQARSSTISTCDAGSQALSWDRPRSESLRRAFIATGAPAAGSTATALATRSAEFVAAWILAKRELCLARDLDHSITAAQAEQRALCLARERARFETMLEVLAEPSQAQVSRVLETAPGPADIEGCADDDRLRRAMALPDEPGMREEVRALSVRLAATEVERDLGEYARGRATASAVVDAALELGYPPLLARARYHVGGFDRELGELEAAIEAWTGAFRLAVELGDDRLAAKTAGSLAHAEGYELGRHDAGIRWAELAQVYYQRSGGDPLAEARSLEILAIMLDLTGEHRRAIEMYEEALALWREVEHPRHRMIGQLGFNLAGARFHSGDRQGAYADSVEAAAIFDEHYGADHPRMARAQAMVAEYALEVGLFEEAELALERALATWARTEDAGVELGDGYNTLGDLRRAQGRPGEAIAAHRYALEIYGKSHSEHDALADTTTRLADALLERGTEADRAEAEQLYGRALELLPARHDPAADPQGRGQALYGLARVAQARSQLELAERRYADALDELRSAAHPSPTAIARCELGLAQVELRREPNAATRARVQARLSSILADDAKSPAIRAEAQALLDSL